MLRHACCGAAVSSPFRQLRGRCRTYVRAESGILPVSESSFPIFIPIALRTLDLKSESRSQIRFQSRLDSVPSAIAIATCWPPAPEKSQSYITLKHTLRQSHLSHHHSFPSRSRHHRPRP